MKESKSRKRVKVKDPISGAVAWKWQDKITIRYNEEEKLPIILEFLKDDFSAEEIVEKYHIYSTQTLMAWVGKYLTEKDSLSCAGQTRIGRRYGQQKQRRPDQGA